jgi:hypothetical protein
MLLLLLGDSGFENQDMEDVMEETFAGVVTEVERVLRPQGFFVESVHRRDKSLEKVWDTHSEMEKEAEEDAELIITVIRRGRLG